MCVHVGVCIACVHVCACSVCCMWWVHCMCVCVRGVCTCVHAGVCHVYTEAEKGCWTSCSITLYLIPLRQNLSLYLKVGWKPSRPCHPPVSTQHSTGVTSTYLAELGFYTGYGDLNSGLHVCTESTLVSIPSL